ncbi:hypothetical protein ACNKHR_18035 [Shigella flexneri]
MTAKSPARRAAAGGSGNERPLRAERGERSLGAHYTMRYTAATSSRRKGRWPAATIRNAVRRLSWGRRFLDESLPLENGSYEDVVAFKVVDKQLRIRLENGKEIHVTHPGAVCRLPWRCRCADRILLKNNGLRIELQIDANGRIGKDDPAHVTMLS